jgi:hypothetical protein
MKKGFFVLPLLALSLAGSAIAGSQVSSHSHKGTSAGLAGPYQKGVVVLNMSNYKGVSDVSVISTCDPKGIHMHVNSGLFKPGKDTQSTSTIKGPFQEGVVVLHLADFASAKNVDVIGQCSPAGISMTVKSR